MKTLRKSNPQTKLVVAICLGSIMAVSACGGGGNVSPYSADRADQTLNEGTSSEVRVLARATDFDKEQGVSTRGRAEVIYSSATRSGSGRADRADILADALSRARQNTGCQQASHTHSQESLRGTHVMIALAGCPPISRR